jgi:hypothetical protein
LYVNAGVAVLNTWLIALLAWRWSNHRWLAALAAGVMLTVSRFAYATVLVVTGLKEGLAMAFLLGILHALTSFYATGSQRALAAVLVLYTLQVYSHERFLLLAGFVGLAVLAAPHGLDRRATRVAWAVVPALVVLGNYVAKAGLLQAEFFRGTAGTAIAIDAGRVASFMLAGFVNLFGFNVGPSYLSGLHVAEAGWVGVALGAALTLPVAALGLIYLRSGRPQYDPASRYAECRNALLFAVLSLSLLATASVTIRQEYRWLHAPYAAFVLGVACLVGRTGHARRAATVALSAALAAAVSIDVFYRRHLGNVFFIDGLAVAHAARTEIIEPYGRDLAARRFYVIDAGPGRAREFYFNEQRFFQVYSGIDSLITRYVQTVDEILEDPEVEPAHLLAFATRQGTVEDVTPAIVSRLAEGGRTAADTRLDLMSPPDRCVASDTRPAGTPTGRGIFVHEWPTPLGSSTGLTIVSGFGCRLDDVDVRSGEALVLTAAVPLAGGDGARLRVLAEPPGAAAEVLASEELRPAMGEAVEWRSFRIAVNRFARQTIAIRLVVDSPSGDATADWVAITGARIVATELR